MKDDKSGGAGGGWHKAFYAIDEMRFLKGANDGVVY